MSSFLRSSINIISTTSFRLGLACSSATFCHIEKQPFIDSSVPWVFAGHTTAYLLHNDLLIFSIRSLLVGFQKCCCHLLLFPSTLLKGGDSSKYLCLSSRQRRARISVVTEPFAFCSSYSRKSQLKSLLWYNIWFIPFLLTNSHFYSLVFFYLKLNQC